MTEQDIITLTNEVFEETFEIPRDDLRPEKSLFDDLGLDSLDTVDLVVALQKKFGVQIRNDARAQQIRTLGDTHRYIVAVVAETTARPNSGS